MTLVFLLQWRGTVLAEKETPKVMKCDRFQDFWVAWFNNNFRIGQGDIIGRKTLFYLPLRGSYPFNAIGMSTGWGDDGIWRIEEDNGTYNI